MPPKVIEAIEQRVTEGHVSDKSDFVLLAVREKLEKMEAAA